MSVTVCFKNGGQVTVNTATCARPRELSLVRGALPRSTEILACEDAAGKEVDVSVQDDVVGWSVEA